MWLFTRYGFFSLSVKDKTGKQVTIRARKRAHLVALLTALNKRLDIKRIASTPANDYPFRVVLPKEVAAAMLQTLVLEQTWHNFKDETKRFKAGKDENYVSLLHEVWFQGRRFLGTTKKDMYGGPGPGALSDEDIIRIFGEEK